jgi:ATP-dependent helicase/nuclease subunit A
VDPGFEVLVEGIQASLQAQAADETLAWATTQEALLPLFSALSAEGLREALGALLRRRLDVSRAFAQLPEDPWVRWGEVLSGRLASFLSMPEPKEALDSLSALEISGAISRAERMKDGLAPYLRSLLATWREVQGALARGDWPRVICLLPNLRRAMSSHGSDRNWPAPSPKGTIRRLRDWYKATIEQGLLGEKGDKVDPALDRTLASLMIPLRRAYEYALGRYVALKEERQALDFDDLEDRALRLLAHPARRDVLAHWQGEVAALLVDEFQDTNARQRDLIALLDGASPIAEEVLAPGARSAGRLFIVGDGKQSIYRFRGADVAVFRQERLAIARRGGESFVLGTSYRAHALLLEGLNALMASILSPADDPARPYAEPFARLEPYRPAAAGGFAGPPIEGHFTIGPKTEGALERAAAALARRLVALVEEEEMLIEEEERQRQLSYGDIAILCRGTRSFAAYEDALDAAGVPYVTVAGRGFYERPEIRDLLNLLSAIADEGDDLALAGALRSPALAISDAGLYTLCAARDARLEPRPTLWQVLGELAEGQASTPELAPRDRVRMGHAASLIGTLRTVVGRVSIAALLKRTLDETHYRAILIRAGQSRAVRNVDKLLADAHTSGLIGVGEFLEYVQTLRDVGAREGEARSLGEGAVQIMTVHAAKGLEFPVVVLGDISAAGSSRGAKVLVDPELGPLVKLRTDDDKAQPVTFGLAQWRDQDQEQEEGRRLFYVAATRAREKLILSANLPKPKKDGTLGDRAGWVSWLADEKALNLCGEPLPLDEAGGQPLYLDRALGPAPVGCWFYPQSYEPPARRPEAECPPTHEAFPEPMPLLASVREEMAPIDPKVEAEERRPSQHAWRVVPQGAGHYPRRVLGRLVHEALAQWRFPASEFGAWAETVCRSCGLADASSIKRAAGDAARLLARFRQHSLFERMEAATRRLHEVPFSMMEEGSPSNGLIDALFLEPNGRWHLVEFKTDHIPRGKSLQTFLYSTKHLEQTRRYMRAVERWLGQVPLASLVLLDLHGDIHEETVSMPEA